MHRTEACDNRSHSGADVTRDRASSWQRNRWLTWVAGGLVLGLAAVAGGLVILARRAEPFLHARIVQELQQHFHARVELDSFHISLANGLRAEGKGLRIWPPAPMADETAPAEPMIRLDDFRFHVPLRYQPGKTIHIPLVELKGLHVNLPPRPHFGRPAVETAKPGGNRAMVSFQVETLECTGAQLVLGTAKPGKLPLDFAIAHFKLTNVASGAAMGFDATLTNPRPVGTIYSTGTLGPWQVADPGETPITGDYRFDHADLSIFKGIAGILTSTGHYQGTLRDLVVDGEADVPDFRLSHFGNAQPLSTRFHARVDGTNGDTWLEPVHAILGRSRFTTEGKIVRVFAGHPKDESLSLEARAGESPTVRVLGHDIALKVNVAQGRVEDFTRLASRSPTPLLTGDITLQATLHIPPGAAPVPQRMTVEGKFTLTQTRFTSAKIQNRIVELSLRGQGRPNDIKTTDPATISARMNGVFRLAAETLTLPAFEYTVPGADIRMRGAYGLEGGTLDFSGSVRTDATVSKMVGGWKGFLLKPADRFFRKNGAGTEITIQIQGTLEDPRFAIGFNRIQERPASTQ